MLKSTLDYMICSLCHVITPYFAHMLNLIGPFIDERHCKAHESALTSLARASNSSQGATDLLESRILQNVVENVSRICRRFLKGSKIVSSKTTDEEAMLQTSSDNLQKMLGFLTLCLNNHKLKTWLGKDEGCSFWQPLISFLTECRFSVSSRVSGLESLPMRARVLASLQTTSVRYLRTCVCNHAKNQQNLARVLYELLATVDSDVAEKTLSGFLRRLVLELLLDEDSVTMAVTLSTMTSQRFETSSGLASQSPLWHPRFGASNSCKLLSVRVNRKVHEVLHKFTVDPMQLFSTISTGTTDSTGKSSESFHEIDKILEFDADLSQQETFSLASSAINVKNRRAKHSDKTEKGPGSECNQSSTSSSEVKNFNENIVCCVDGPLAGKPLPKDTTVSQIVQTLVEHGQGMGTVCLRFEIKSKMECISQDVSNDNVSSKSVSTLLEKFSELGGLSLIAKHLPPRFTLDIRSDSRRLATPTYNPTVTTSLVPGHSLMGFTMFLRLPGYAKILLANQQNACYMLKLILGVDSFNDGGMCYVTHYLLHFLVFSDEY